ncbi:ATP-binding protein, partial [Candidatus Bathyarchaeota archaeon]|nr:ATP-binding protein [Candidatus Bathyarchaeota archaeon]
MSLFLGKEMVNESPVELPVKAFHRHLMALGASGSGKTVLCKCVMEEAVRNDIPLIIVDPQGDISSLALKGDPEEIEKHGTPLAIQEEFFEKARVAIFTPASSKGIPISVNPLKFPPEDTPREESILAIDMTATSLTSFLGYDLNSDAGKGAKAYLFTILEHLWREGQTIKDMGHMADIVLRPPAKITGVLYDLVTKKEPQEIARKLRFLTVGTPSLMFQMGVQINIDMFMDRSDGKVPVNIIYMNTLSSANDKQFFLATLLRELYCWMLKNPSEDVQLLFYVDEIAPYIPPYPRNPPPKEAYALLFKQARKYGIGLVAATQNVTDIDYKALAQVNTWCLGRMMTKQDVARVQKIIQSIDPMRADMVLQRLPSLQTGEFLMLSPDYYDNVVDFKVRRLVTDHLTLDEKDLPQCLSPESEMFFEKYLLQQKEVAEKPVAPSVPSKPLEERIRLFLNSARQGVSADSIAENLKVDVQHVEEALNELVKTRIVEKGRVKGSAENLYWLSKFGFKPSKSIIGEVLTVPIRITQVEASKRVRPMLEGGLFGKKEEIYDAELSHIPIWRVSATRETKRFIFKKKKFDTYYMSAQTGAIISLEKKKIIFHKLMTKSVEKLKDLDDDDDITFIPKLPGEVEGFPRIGMGIDKIYRKLQLTLGVKPVSAEIILLPVWTL